MFVSLLTLFFSWTLHSHLELCLQLIKVGFSRANEEIQAFRRENTDLKKELNELKDMTAQGKRKKPVSLSHVQDETKSVIKGKDYFLSKVSFNSYIVQNYWIWSRYYYWVVRYFKYIWNLKILVLVTFNFGHDPDSHVSALVLLPQSLSVLAFSESNPSGSALKAMRIHNTDPMPPSILETLEPSPSSGYTDESKEFDDSQQFDDSQPESHSVLGKKNSFLCLSLTLLQIFNKHCIMIMCRWGYFSLHNRE